MEETKIVNKYNFPNNIDDFSKSEHTISTSDDKIMKITIVGTSELLDDEGSLGYRDCDVINNILFSSKEIEIWNDNYGLTIYNEPYVFEITFNIASFFKLYDYIDKFQLLNRLDYTKLNEDYYIDFKNNNYGILVKKNKPNDIYYNLIKIPKYVKHWSIFSLKEAITDNNIIEFVRYMNTFWIRKSQNILESNDEFDIAWFDCCKYNNIQFLNWMYDNDIYNTSVSYCMNIAAEYGHLDVIKLLQSWDIQASNTTLIRATMNEHTHVINYLNEQGIFL